MLVSQRIKKAILHHLSLQEIKNNKKMFLKYNRDKKYSLPKLFFKSKQKKSKLNKKEHKHHSNKRLKLHKFTISNLSLIEN